mmetsp:Transcript_22798/g.29531  ORF Transcript_22798/g.29531 Transcript_22798/m.29531 type:complete len:150 (+) Transcript_22798:37-486(+)
MENHKAAVEELRANVYRRRKDIKETRAARRAYSGEREELSDVLMEAPGISEFLKRSKTVLEKRGAQKVPDANSHAQVPISQLWQRRISVESTNDKSKTSSKRPGTPLDIKSLSRQVQSRFHFDTYSHKEPRQDDNSSAKKDYTSGLFSY